jgi:hypothetical protein
MSLFRKVVTSVCVATLALLGVLACIAITPRTASARGILATHARVVGTYGTLVGSALKLVATPQPIDPPGNFLYTVPGSCSTAPLGDPCLNSARTQLDAARASMGLPAYQYPTDFNSLPGPDRLLILSNEDRVAYGEQPILGLNASVNAAAQAGAIADEDPGYPPDLPPGWSWATNNAINLPNDLFDYMFWMWADGYTGVPGFGNIDCLTPNAPGCWDHRHDIFAFPDWQGNVMGAGSGTDSQGRPVFGLEVLEAEISVPLVYTWAQAVADGAGPSGPPVTTMATTATTSTSMTTATTATTTRSSTTTPTTPTTTAFTTATTAPTVPVTTVTASVTTTKQPTSKPKQYRLVCKIVGPGSIEVRPGACNRKYRPGTPLLLTAQPKRGGRFSSWSGPCTNHKLTCRFRMNKAKAIKAVFAPR